MLDISFKKYRLKGDARVAFLRFREEFGCKDPYRIRIEQKKICEKRRTSGSSPLLVTGDNGMSGIAVERKDPGRSELVDRARGPLKHTDGENHKYFVQGPQVAPVRKRNR